MNKRIIQTIFKQYTFPLIGLIVLLTALPVSIWQISKVANGGAKASTFTLVPYPGITWAQPKPYTVSFLRDAQTPEETIVFSGGQMVTGETEKNVSNEVYFFYNQLLVSKGYNQIGLTGKPDVSPKWVATYELDENICQLQYYPTPYNENRFTVLLFFGNL